MNKHTFFCDKLARSKDPELLQAKGIEVKTRLLEAHEWVDYLKKKLKEESGEICQDKASEDIINELIDLYDAGDLLKKHLGVTEEEFACMREEKRQRKGTYEDGQCLLSVTLVQDHPDLEHYRNHPSGYPEKVVSV
jgi:predicted house-cleaning noncanonical NTP pyrophosphatase (MazG superfamily)